MLHLFRPTSFDEMIDGVVYRRCFPPKSKFLAEYNYCLINYVISIKICSSLKQFPLDNRIRKISKAQIPFNKSKSLESVSQSSEQW